MQRLRGVLAALVVAIPLSLFMVLYLHAGRGLAGLLAAIVGGAIFLVVATRSDEHDIAADVAWREASPDLPPGSERRAMEQAQANLPVPEEPRKTVPAKRRPPKKDARGGKGGVSGEGNVEGGVGAGVE